MAERDLTVELNEMAQEWRQKAENHGFSVDLNDPSEANSKEEAYMLGRFDQTLSIMEALEIESEELDRI